MKHKIYTSLVATPLLLGLAGHSVGATPENEPTKVSELLDSSKSLQQVTSVSQLRDVQPTDWAFQALQSLVERYGCIAGYPDRTFRGNRAMTRYEFAAGLNACMEVMTQLIEQSTADLVRQEDLATLQRLQEEFQAELATLRGRVDSLESRTAELEANQFSTTTRLTGFAYFFLADTFGGEDLPGGGDTQTTFSGVGYLSFETSFSGEDLLRTRIVGGNLPNFDRSETGTNMTQVFARFDTGNDIIFDEFFYRFPVNDSITAWATITGTDIDDIFSQAASTSLNGNALSDFSQHNPLIYEETTGAGFGVNFQLSENLRVDAIYMTSPGDAADSGLGQGFFNGDYATGLQVSYSGGDRFDVSLAYLNSFANNGSANLGGTEGSLNADQPFGDSDTMGHHVGLQAAFRPSSSFEIGAWGGFVFANQTDSDDNATIFTTAVQLAFPDLGGEGNLAGLVIGIPPKAIDNDDSLREDDDTSILVEASYKYQITDNISLTPGVIWVINPEHESGNEDIVLGALQTVFFF
ncbi:iron uptake porin [Geitlerinema sp. PCC 9228]|jgi:hypothetical protein|uniref:iron uptake porin n=1 Tax=Geitlerinema sp. PCC 9228 TaxID=111611 RepID=UPI0008F99784|nr:iron uptake porin [Geitlerinema sp. PCC 9228]